MGDDEKGCFKFLHNFNLDLQMVPKGKLHFLSSLSLPFMVEYNWSSGRIRMGNVFIFVCVLIPDLNIQSLVLVKKKKH